MNALDIQTVSKVFRGKRGHLVTALSDLTLTVRKGEVFGFLGPNGAGKSTTIKCLIGLISPTSGSAQILGAPIVTVASRRSIGYLPENPSFFDYLTAEEYLRFVTDTFEMPKNQAEHKIEEILRLLELWDVRRRPMRGYSKGMIQRVGLAQTLVHDPEVFILDEPMSGLDPIGRALVKDIILELKERGKSVFFSTHITADVEQVCDRVGVIVKGRLVALDAVENVLRRGIDGYLIQLSLEGKDFTRLPGYTPIRVNGPLAEYYVKRDEFNDFMASVSQIGAQVTLVETKRRDLEDFFLSLVQEH